MNNKDIIKLVHEFSGNLKLKENTILRAIDLVNKSTKAFLTSSNKQEGVAAASIYIAGILEDDRKTQKEIAEVADVPESTIRNLYLKIARGLELKK